jgi:hypothetical protein
MTAIMAMSGDSCARVLAPIAVIWITGAILLHSSLSRAMRRRGVVPWRVRDTMGAFPLSLAGAALLLASLGGGWCMGRWLVPSIGIVIAACWMLFGARAYRKLVG